MNDIEKARLRRMIDDLNAMRKTLRGMAGFKELQNENAASAPVTHIGIRASQSSAGFLADAADHIGDGIDAISDALKSER